MTYVTNACVIFHVQISMFGEKTFLWRGSWMYFTIVFYYISVVHLYICVDFDGDSTADNIRFVIKRLKIWADPTDADYPFSGNMDVRTFLEVSDNCQDLYLGFCTY